MVAVPPLLAGGAVGHRTSQAAVHVTAVLREALALWLVLTAEAPPLTSGGEGAAAGDTGRVRAARMLRAAEVCAEALGVPVAGPPVPNVRSWPGTGADMVGLQALTPRELDVLRLLAEGRTDREVAAALSVSRRTVTTHVTSIFNKLGVATRTAAVARAIRGGLI